MSKTKQSNFKESRLIEYDRIFKGTVMWRGQRQFLSETIDMAEKEKFIDMDKLSQDITDIFYFETSRGSWKFVSRKEMVKDLLIKSLSPNK